VKPGPPFGGSLFPEPRHCRLSRREGPANRDKSEDLPERFRKLELSGKKAMSYRSIIYRSLFVYFQHKRLIVILLYICLPLILVSGQDMFSEDTIRINEVRVTAAGSIRHIPFSTMGMDSVIISNFRDNDLGSLLQASSPVFLKQNGNSGLASVTMRGMSGSHTLVLWNGISITGSNTGMADFAIIPVMSASAVLVTGGGADLEEISGSIGGKIELLSEPSEVPGTQASVATIAGSNNKYASLVTIKTGNAKISANFSLWGKRAENDFPFNNMDAPGGAVKLRRENAATASAAIMHDLFFNGANSSAALHLWYNLSDRELPGPVTTVQQNFGETQDDRALRGAISFKTTAGKLSLDIISGLTVDANTYNNEVAAIQGDNKSAAYTFRTAFKYRLRENLEFGLNLGDEYQTASSLSYEGRKERNLLSSSLSAVFYPAKRLRLTLQARQVTEDTKFVTPEFTGGGSYLISSDGRSILRANMSRNVKLPTLNDLFWNPGGTADLDPEISTGAEIGYSYNDVTATGIHNSIDITLYATGVKDLIQWVPGEYGYWSAENIRDVKVHGLETMVKKIIPVSRGKITMGTNYSLTGSMVKSSGVLNDKSIGKQLLYTPVHHLSANFSVNYAFLNGGLRLFADSRRFTTADNSEWLPAAFQVNTDIGAALPLERTLIKIDFCADNILNRAWESMRNYPMPLRTYRIKLNFNLFSKPKNVTI